MEFAEIRCPFVEKYQNPGFYESPLFFKPLSSIYPRQEVMHEYFPKAR
jgi:hypothetical protein